jgi:hypothetical protein
MEAEMERRESDMLQKFIEEKNKIRIMNERQEDEEKIKRRLRELDCRERPRKRERELITRRRDLDRKEKDLDILEQRQISSSIDRLAPDSVYLSKRGQSLSDNRSPTPPKLDL